MWEQLEFTPPHLSYVFISAFLIVYAIFSSFIRNRLHLSEPPLALLFGVILGPYVLSVLNFQQWGIDDVATQEFTRIIVGLQCFVVGLELPKHYFFRHWTSVAYLLGPVMTFSWAITSLFAYLIFQTTLPAAMIIGACLSPTDPVLAASVLSNSRFSTRVPKRLRNMLSAESACNDGVSFPFLYIGLVAYTTSTTGSAIKEWFLITILWQCVFGVLLGLIIGRLANRALRFVSEREYISRQCFLVFYFLLAILSVGMGSILGSDDFLVAFGAGVGFAHDGWFTRKTGDDPLPDILDLLLNASMFVYFGATIPWNKFSPTDLTPHCGVWQLFTFLLLVLLFRRIPIVLAVKRFVPNIHTYREALFCGHFGPMGLGALFLAIEARAQLETGTSLPMGKPASPTPPYTDHDRIIALIWPVICFVVLGSTLIHSFSVAAISLASHYSRKVGERAPLLATEEDGLDDMEHEDGDGESEPDISGSE